jgi:hypothetical protein
MADTGSGGRAVLSAGSREWTSPREAVGHPSSWDGKLPIGSQMLCEVLSAL